MEEICMKGFREIDPKEIENTIKLIGSDWMLITAADKEKVNTMTASWGCMGVLWNKPVCICYIRPQRYTYEFVEQSDRLSLSFFTEEYRSALNICGTKSGRDCDKIALAGLTVCTDETGTPYFEEAKTVIRCKKIYADDIKKENVLLPEIFNNYKNNDFHRFYICEIEHVSVREDI